MPCPIVAHTGKRPCPCHPNDGSCGIMFGGMGDADTTTEPCKRIWAILAGIDDPEMPISIVDLGIVAGVRVEQGVAQVAITPTYTGCPALQMIDDLIRAQVGALPEIDDVQIEHVFDPPWQADRISEAGKERLRKHGVTVAGPKLTQLRVPHPEPIRCPFCNSEKTRVDSPFGPTRCRMIYYCMACRNTFEHIKTV